MPGRLCPGPALRCKSAGPHCSSQRRSHRLPEAPQVEKRSWGPHRNPQHCPAHIHAACHSQLARDLSSQHSLVPWLLCRFHAHCVTRSAGGRSTRCKYPAGALPQVEISPAGAYVPFTMALDALLVSPAGQESAQVRNPGCQARALSTCDAHLSCSEHIQATQIILRFPLKILNLSLSTKVSAPGRLPGGVQHESQERLKKI